VSKQAHLPPPLTSLTRHPGATLLSATSQPIDERHLSFVVIVYLGCHGKYPHATFVPTHLAETQDDDGTTMWPMRGTTMTMTTT